MTERKYAIRSARGFVPAPRKVAMATDTSTRGKIVAPLQHEAAGCCDEVPQEGRIASNETTPPGEKTKHASPPADVSNPEELRGDVLRCRRKYNKTRQDLTRFDLKTKPHHGLRSPMILILKDPAEFSRLRVEKNATNLVGRQTDGCRNSPRHL